MKILNFICTAMLFVSANVLADPANNPWVQCGTIADFDSYYRNYLDKSLNACDIPAKPSTKFEYGIAYNSKEPLPVVCTLWNHGVRIANKEPYLVNSDNPSTGMRYGGFVFYRGTDATDECPNSGEYRQRYWALGINGIVETDWHGSNGCHGNASSEKPILVFCRKR